MVDHFSSCGDISRVIESWRALDREEILAKPFGDLDDDYAKQEARSFLEGLTTVPFWDVKATKGLKEYAKKLEQHYKTIREEFLSVSSDSGAMSGGNNVWAAAADSDSAASYGPDWKTLALMDRTTWDPVNTHLFPKTCAALIDSGVPCVEAFFARMDGNTKVIIKSRCLA